MRDKKIYLAGHTGLVGNAIFSKLKEVGYKNIVVATHKELDLTRQRETEKFFDDERPNLVILAAAKVGGIRANMSMPAEFGYINSMISANVIHSAYKFGAEKLLFLGSSCIYPRNCEQPMKEDYLLSGIPEPTNEAYAISKIMGLKFCEYYNKQYNSNFISAMPCNIYGEGDTFDVNDSHVVPALIMKIHRAKKEKIKEVVVWGTGNARRELLYVDDLADACVFLLENYNDSQFVNVGVGEDVSIRELATTICKVVGYDGELVFDTSMPDGMPRKCVDTSKINSLGWYSKIKLEEGLSRVYKWYIENVEAK